jgi:hypothetical protein
LQRRTETWNSYFWSDEKAQKDSWQTIRPREYFVFPRKGNDGSNACTRIVLADARNRWSRFRVFPDFLWPPAPAADRTLARHATHILAGTGHSRTLYTSNTLEQNNFINEG